MSHPKDETITRLLADLRLADRGWILVDHWEADLHAVGIADPRSPRRLVYVSTFNRGPGRYYFEREIPSGSDETDYEVVRCVEDADFDTLVAALERHLNP